MPDYPTFPFHFVLSSPLFAVWHERYQVPIDRRNNYRTLTIVLESDGITEIDVQLELFGKSFVGDVLRRKEESQSSLPADFETEITKAVADRVIKTKAMSNELAGTVTDESGKPLENVKAHIYPWVAADRFIKKTNAKVLVSHFLELGWRKRGDLRRRKLSSEIQFLRHGSRIDGSYAFI